MYVLACDHVHDIVALVYLYKYGDGQQCMSMCNV